MLKMSAAAAVVAAMWVMGAEPAQAQNRNWCTQGPIGSWGFPYCAYDTLAQCQAAASGTRRSCTRNYYQAYWAEKERQERAARKKQRR